MNSKCHKEAAIKYLGLSKQSEHGQVWGEYIEPQRRTETDVMV